MCLNIVGVLDESMNLCIVHAEMPSYDAQSWEQWALMTIIVLEKHLPRQSWRRAMLSLSKRAYYASENQGGNVRSDFLSFYSFHQQVFYHLCSSFILYLKGMLCVGSSVLKTRSTSVLHFLSFNVWLIQNWLPWQVKENVSLGVFCPDKCTFYEHFCRYQAFCVHIK